MVREQDCNCGCNLKIAECRMKDPKCGYSRALAAAVVREFKDGKNADQVYAVLRELQKQGPVKPRVLEDAVTIPVKDDPSQGHGCGEGYDRHILGFSMSLLRNGRSESRSACRPVPSGCQAGLQTVLDSHSNAYQAAEASLAAHAQGEFLATSR